MRVRHRSIVIGNVDDGWNAEDRKGERSARRTKGKEKETEKEREDKGDDGKSVAKHGGGRKRNKEVKSPMKKKIFL